MITEWTYDLTMPKAEVDDTADTVDVGYVGLLRPDTRSDEELDADMPTEDVEVELVGWFE